MSPASQTWFRSLQPFLERVIRRRSPITKCTCTDRPLLTPTAIVGFSAEFGKIKVCSQYSSLLNGNCFLQVKQEASSRENSASVSEIRSAGHSQ